MRTHAHGCAHACAHACARGGKPPLAAWLACTIERLPACPKPIVWTRFTEIAGNGAPTTCGYNLRMLMIMFREECGSQFGRLRLEKLFDLSIDEHLCMHNSMFAGLPYANCLETFYGNCGQCRCHNLWLPFATVCGYVSGPCGRQFGRLRLENCSASALMNTCACTIQCLPDCPTLIVWTNFTEMAGNGAPTTCGYHLGLSVIMCRNGCGSQFGRLRLENVSGL